MGCLENLALAYLTIKPWLVHREKVSGLENGVSDEVSKETMCGGSPRVLCRPRGLKYHHHGVAVPSALRSALGGLRGFVITSANL